MKNEIFERAKRFLKMSHSGLIYLCNLERYDAVKEKDDEYYIGQAELQDLPLVADFYNHMGYASNDIDKLTKWHVAGSRIYVVKYKKCIIAATVMLRGCMAHCLEGFSKYVFISKLNGKIIFDQDVMYAYNIIVDPQFRKQHIFKRLLSYMLIDLKESEYKKILMTTGVNNWAMIHTLRQNFDLIGIVKIRVWLRCLLIRNVISLQSDSVCWKTERKNGE